ncbi:MAG: hypothetical protein M1832_004361 [Thelocarpon impressellum]|nr:MAG: hypothetical protein M1832_004361 [Thelocarpon impressellum]
MKFAASSIAVLGLASLGSATNAKRNYWTSVECTGEKTVTVTVAATGAGQAPAPTAAYAAAPPPAAHDKKPYVTTKDGVVSSVDYSTKTTSTKCPSAGVYAHPAKSGSSYTVNAPTWYTYEVPYATVYAYPTGKPKTDATVVVYQDKQVVNISVVTIEVVVENGATKTVTASKTDKPTYTPPPPPPASYSAPTGAPTGVFTVTVGLDNGKTLKFDPPFLPKVPKGSKVHFDFRARNHTLTESSFADPCKKLAGTPIDTNFQNVNIADVPGQNATDIVLDTEENKPRWFYCKQGNGTPNGHCGLGMVFAINTDEAKFNEFLGKAKATLPKVKGRSPSF